jgi:hypothetical protein
MATLKDKRMSYHVPTDDLFAAHRAMPISAPAVEARARVVRAKNAALQRPLSYLDVSRNQFTNDDIKLFDEINPIQIAQYFLEKISDSMIFGVATPISETKGIVCDYVRRLDFKQLLTDDQYDRVVDKIIGALRNEHQNYALFREVIRNEVTGEQIEFKFALVTVHSTIISGREEYVFKLTQEGVKLLHLNWQAPDDFDMYAVMIETALKSGKYNEAGEHINRCRLSSVKIEAALGEIELKLHQQSYDKDFADEIDGLIKAVKVEAATFGQISNGHSHLIKMGRDAEDLDEETRRSLDNVALQIRELQRIHARFTLTIDKVYAGFKRFQARQISDLGVRYTVADLMIDFLQPMAMLPKDIIAEGGIADAIIASIHSTKCPAIFDPFVLWETARLSDDADIEEPEEETASYEIASSKRTSIADLRSTKTFLDSVLRKYGEKGIRLSAIFELIDRQPQFSRELKFTIAHRAAFISQKFMNSHVSKIDDGTRLVDCKYVSGPDLLLKVEKL